MVALVPGSGYRSTRTLCSIVLADAVRAVEVRAGERTLTEVRLRGIEIERNAQVCR
jgi:hypothetical protein